MKRFMAMLALSFALGLGGLYLVAGTALFEPGTYRFRDLDTLALIVGGASLIAQWMAPGLKVSLLCRGQGINMPYRPALMAHLVAVLGAAVTPSNTGGVPVTVAALGRLGVPVGKGIGVVVQIFVLDLVFFSWSAPLGLGYLVYSNTLPLPVRSEALAVVAASLAVVGAIVLTRYPRLVVRLLLSLARWPFLSRFRDRISNAARDYYRSARMYSRMSAAKWLTLHAVTAVGWLAGFVVLWSLLKLYGVDAGIPAILALLSSITLISHFVPTPGGSGFIEAAAALAVGAGVGTVAAAVLLWRLLSFYLIFLIGPVAGWRLYRFKPISCSGPEPSKARRRGPEKRP